MVDKEVLRAGLGWCQHCGKGQAAWDILTAPELALEMQWIWSQTAKLAELPELGRQRSSTPNKAPWLVPGHPNY